jgi:hypothetical protein
MILLKRKQLRNYNRTKKQVRDQNKIKKNKLRDLICNLA